MCVPVWWRIRDQRRSSSTMPLSRSPRRSMPPTMWWSTTSPTLTTPSTRTIASALTSVPVSAGWPPPSGIEESLVEHCVLIEEVEHDRLELNIRGLIVVDLLRGRQCQQPVSVLCRLVHLHFLLGFGVRVCNHRVEIVREIDHCPLFGGDVPHHLRLDAMANRRGS